MKIDKNYPGLVDIGWAFKFEGSIKTSESLESWKATMEEIEVSA